MLLDFMSPALKDKEWISPIMEESNRMGADTSFASLFLWGYIHDVRVVRFKNSIIRAKFKDDQIVDYSFPIGQEDIKQSCEAIFQDASQRGTAPVITAVYEENKAFLETAYKDCFNFIEARSFADYIYSQKDLALLPGRKYHGKRSHISKFIRSNKNFELIPISPDNKKDALYVAKEWCRQVNGENCGEKDPELCAIERCFKYFEELSLFGALLYVDKKPAAMTVASKINKNVCEIHFEKALKDVDGAYAMINNGFAKTLESFKWINREEDMGIEGLRKAKLSYYPEILLQKYKAVPVVKN